MSLIIPSVYLPKKDYIKFNHQLPSHTKCTLFITLNTNPRVI